jgi:hypothetical protein
MDTPDQPSFDEQFEDAVAEWKHRHQLREDDAVFLLVELFRIHQQHWDELRHRELPSFDEIHNDIIKLAEAARIFQQQTATLLEKLPRAVTQRRPLTVTWAAALFATLAAGLGGYLLGRALL